MRLVAQRVRSPANSEGINAFCFLHGPIAWLESPPPEIEQSQGVLMNSHVEVPPPGNRVRSYLEIMTPDDTPNHQVERDVTESIDLLQDLPFPFKLEGGGTTFEFDVELALAPAWRRELLFLLHRALEARV